jgi:hypothetical protein
MSRLICLANSRKHSGRCIAGLDVCTGKWIRPVTTLDDGRIPVNMALINGEHIQPLDIVDIPLGDNGHGYECENRTILEGAWSKVGRANTEDIIAYCDKTIIHSHCSDWLKAIPYSYLSSLPKGQRRTLQMAKIKGFKAWCNDYGKWKGEIPLSNGQSLVANLTDPELCAKLGEGYTLSSQCLVILSLGQPWKKSASEDELLCYRLIVGVVEL